MSSCRWHHRAKYRLPVIRVQIDCWNSTVTKDIDRRVAVDLAARAWSELANQWFLVRVPRVMEIDSAQYAQY